MTQTDLITQLEKSTDNAVFTAGAFADRDWYSEATATVELLIRRGEDFTTDDVHEILDQLSVETHEKRALGAIMRHFSKKGVISAISYRKSLRPECHRRPVAIWRPRPALLRAMA